MCIRDRYKIVFKRVWHNGDHTDEIDINKESGNGRYDTKCEIYVRDMTMVGKGFEPVFKKEPSFTGIARLHPNDKPDKIIGKKIALRNAMDLHDGDLGKVVYPRNPSFPKYRDPFFKELRTAIWKAFFAWVEGWNTRYTK